MQQYLAQTIMIFFNQLSNRRNLGLSPGQRAGASRIKVLPNICNNLRYLRFLSVHVCESVLSMHVAIESTSVRPPRWSGSSVTSSLIFSNLHAEYTKLGVLNGSVQRRR